MISTYEPLPPSVMKIMPDFNQLKEKIAKDIEEGIALISRAGIEYTVHYNDYLVIRNSFNELKKEIHSGLISDTDYGVRRNKITRSLLGIIDSWKASDSSENESIPYRTGPTGLENNKDLSTTPFPVAFISYSWDSEAHKNWVLKLANDLISSGIDVILDQYDLTLGKNLTHFMERSVTQSDKIILVLTENYKLKADNRTGGVGYEYSMINEELYRNQAQNKKFIPVLRAGNVEASIPRFVKSFIWLDMTDDFSYQKNLENLVREIHNTPKFIKPQLGKNPYASSGEHTPQRSLFANNTIPDFKNFAWLDVHPFFLETFDAANSKTDFFNDSIDDIWRAKRIEGKYVLRNQTEARAVKYFHLNIDNKEMSKFPASIEVKIEAQDNYPQPSAGLQFCLNRETKRYYAFFINNQREFKLWRKDENAYTPLFSGRSPEIHANDFNKIGIIKNQQEIYLFINDKYVKKILDGELKSGDSGLIAFGKGSFYFDNLSFYEKE